MSPVSESSNRTIVPPVQEVRERLTRSLRDVHLLRKLLKVSEQAERFQKDERNGGLRRAE